MPGRLYVADDGTIEFRDRTNAVMYRNVPSTAATNCMLELHSVPGAAPTLTVVSTATNRIVTMLYPPAAR